MNAVEGVKRVAQVRLPCIAPGNKERRCHITDARRVRTRQVGSGGRKLSLFDIVNRDRQARQVVGRIAHEEPFAKSGGARFVAVRESSGEGALEEIRISRITSQGLSVVDFRRKRVAISACNQSREIVSGLAVADLQVPRPRFGLDSRGPERRRWIATAAPLRRKRAR